MKARKSSKRMASNADGNYLTPKEIIELLKQQETKVNELARLIRLVPWTREEFDTDSTVPYEKFATPITILTGGDWWKPVYHFLDGQGDNEGVLPPEILSVLKVHGKDVYNLEVNPFLAKEDEFRQSARIHGANWGTIKSNSFAVKGSKVAASMALVKAFSTPKGKAGRK